MRGSNRSIHGAIGVLALLIAAASPAVRAERAPVLPDGFAPPPSVHQLDAEAHAQQGLGPDGPMPRMDRFPPGFPVVSKDVFGWLPYWEWSSGQILNELQWDLLTHVAYFSVGVDGAGNISDGNASWASRAPMFVPVAHQKGVKALLAVTQFDSGEISALLGSPTNRQNAITNLIDWVVPYGADGLAIDFEGLPVSQKANMVTFLRDLKDQLHDQVPQGDVWVATPAVDWSGAWDYDQIMDGIDGVFVMAYDYHWSGSSQAGPCSPLEAGDIWGQYTVRWTIDDYQTYGIGRAFRKVSFGFPYYGRYWPTTSTTVPSDTTGSGTSIVYTSAAAEVGSYGRLWDADSLTPYYLKPGPVQVWYDDAQSLGLKYDAVIAERMGGSGMWALGYDGTLPELWDTIRQKLVRTSLGGLAIGIDAGHGGADRGSLGPAGLAEAEVALAVAQELAQLLAAEGAVVTMTRTSDVALTDQERVDALNLAQVDRAISIHFGDEVSPGRNEIAAHVRGSDAVGSLSDSRSEHWAELTAGRLTAATGLPASASNVGVGGVHADDLALVRDPEASSILVHASTITDAAQEALLGDPGYRCDLAYELYRGVMDSFGIVPRPSTCGASVRDVVALAAPGKGSANPPRVRAFELGSGSPRLDIIAYGASGYGAKGSGGDLDGGGDGEVLTGPGPGAVYGPQVRAFDAAGAPVPAINFYAYGTLRYGVNVAAGDVAAAGWAAIATGAGPGSVFGPHVRGFQKAAGGPVAPLPGLSFYAYTTLRYGCRTASGALDADARDEIATAPGPGAIFGPQVRGFEYQGGVTAMAKVNFWAYPETGYGAKVALGKLDGDAYAEIATGRGEGPGHDGLVKGWNFDASAVSPMAGIAVTRFATLYGANVAAGDVDEEGRDELLVGPGPDPAAAARIQGYDADGSTPVALPGLDLDAFPGMAYGTEAGAVVLLP